MLQERTLFSGSIVDVSDVTCRVTSPHRSCEEHSAAHCIVIPRRGAYIRHVGKHQLLADSTHALFFNAGEPYRVSHPIGLGDDCTALTFDSATLLSVLDDARQAKSPERPFQSWQVMLSARAVLLGHKLFRRCQKADCQLAIEETSLSLLHAIMSAGHGDETRQAPESNASRRQHRELVEAVRLLILSHPGQRHTLTQLARAVGCSPFHLTRTCQRVMGLPLHQYVLRLRMAIALERIRGGETTFSRLAFDLGFSSHSHFSATFRRIYGVRPSELTA